MIKSVRKYYAHFWKDGKVTELHIFTLEPPGKNDYCASISSTYFRDREASLMCHNLKAQPFRAHVISETDFKCNEVFKKRAYALTGEEPPVLPQFEHASLWDFYKAIGYDFRKKEYTRKSGEVNEA